MAEPVRKLDSPPGDFGEELTPAQQEKAKRLIMAARKASVGQGGRRPAPRRGRAVDSVQTGAPVNDRFIPEQSAPADNEDEEQDVSAPDEQRQEPRTDIPTGEPENVAPADQGPVASSWRKRLEAKRQARAEQYKSLGIEGAGADVKAKSFVNRYRRIKTIIRAIKAVSAVGTALGDVFFSIWVLFLSINGERLGEWLFTKFRPQYQKQLEEQKKNDPFRIFDDVLFWGGWLLIFMVLLLAAALIVFLYQQFGSLGGGAALKFIGK